MFRRCTSVESSAIQIYYKELSVRYRSARSQYARYTLRAGLVLLRHTICYFYHLMPRSRLVAV